VAGPSAGSTEFSDVVVCAVAVRPGPERGTSEEVGAIRSPRRPSGRMSPGLPTSSCRVDLVLAERCPAGATVLPVRCTPAVKYSGVPTEPRFFRGVPMGPKQPTIATRFLLAGAVAVLVLLALEVLVRLTTRGPRWLNPRYVALSQGFAELDALIEDAYSPGSRTIYRDEYLYSAPQKATRHVNFTGYHAARRTPDSVRLDSAEHIVWTFGGSTMQNTETTDSLTIANTWARVLNRALGPTHVKNFGTGGFFSSYELIKFQKLLREVPPSEHPTISIFYDGYNDAEYGFQYGPGSLQKDLSLKLQALVDGNHGITWMYATSQIVSRYSRLWQRTGARVVDATLFPFPEPCPSEENLTAAVHIYASNVRMIRAICELFQIECFFILQPLVVTKAPLAPLEQEALDWLEGHPRFGTEGTRFIRRFYAEAARLLSDEPGFIDASRVLDGRSEADFYDVGHVGALTPPVIGERTASLVLAQLATRHSAGRDGETSHELGCLEGRDLPRGLPEGVRGMRYILGPLRLLPRQRCGPAARRGGDRSGSGGALHAAKGRCVVPEARHRLLSATRRNRGGGSRVRRVLRQAAAEVRAHSGDLSQRRAARDPAVPESGATLDEGEALHRPGDPCRPGLRWARALRGAPRVACRERLLPVALRGGRDPHHRRCRRVGDGIHRRGSGNDLGDPARAALAGFAGPALLGLHLLHWLQGELGRVQGHGTRAVRRAEVRRRS
jgi:hypothetical protein